LKGLNTRVLASSDRLPSALGNRQRLVDVTGQFPTGLGEVSPTAAAASDYFGYRCDPLAGTVALID
jgi:hypothetical protein